MGNPDHLLLEQRALKLAMTTLAFPQRVESGLKNALGNKAPQVEAHLESPVGYSFVIDDAKNVREIAQKLAAHHQTYTELACRWFQAQRPDRQVKLIPQPSYRLYLTLEHGKIVATISPAFASYAAVMEAADVVLLRSRETPPRLPQEELMQLRNAVIQALTATA